MTQGKHRACSPARNSVTFITSRCDYCLRRQDRWEIETLPQMQRVKRDGAWGSVRAHLDHVSQGRCPPGSLPPSHPGFLSFCFPRGRSV